VSERSEARPGRERVLLGLAGGALSLVVAAPVALSSGDLVRWASSPVGLGLPIGWAWLVFVALDAAAATCVLMVVISAARGERGGAFAWLVWVLAGGSALANWRHGQTTPARDDAVFFAAMSLAGPLLLEVTLARLRRWSRQERGAEARPRPRFGAAWLPGVSMRATLRAWQASIRHGLTTTADATAHVRQVDALARLSPQDQVRYAWACGASGEWGARDWLAARGVYVDARTLDAAAAAAAVVPPGSSRGLPAPVVSEVDLSGLTNRDLVRFRWRQGVTDAAQIVEWAQTELGRAVNLREAQRTVREVSEREAPEVRPLRPVAQ
jgi:hypothetical protein